MISVLIPTIQYDHLPNLINGLMREIASVGGELIVSNNGAKTATNQLLSKYYCTIINNVRPRSFAESNNDMARIAKHDKLLLLNDDTAVEVGFIKKMIDTFQLHPKIGVVGCRIQYMSTGSIQHAGVFFTKEGLPYELRYTVTKHPDADRTHEVPAVTGACMMVDKTVWRELNGLDEAFVNGWEDNDFVLRAKERGYKVWYNGSAGIRHVLHGSEKYGRMLKEDANVALYRKRWIETGRVFKLI